MITVYCSPAPVNESVDWNLLYNNPETLYKNRIADMDKQCDKNSNIFYCPSFKNYAEKTIVLTNPIHTKFKIENGQFTTLSSNYTNYVPGPSRTIENVVHFNLSVNWIFFCEQELEITLTGPHFHSTDLNSKTFLCPGTLDISKWFRTINCEFATDLTDKTITIKKDDPVAYVHFNTKEEIRFQRFNMSSDLKKINMACDTSSSWERFVPLYSRYERFVKSSTNKKVLKLIQDNLY